MSRYAEPRYACHVRFLRMHLTMLPKPYLSLDTSRMTALYFCVVGLDVLGELEKEIKEKERKEIIEWIYGCLLYTSPSPRDVEETRMPSSA